ncbi:uncharacterized protein LOC114395257 [Glycine soja]|uniref:uncharacterized protein LOC114395257 n=1 Tax=Glycine soja TaxID=3848 RepID=UPI00103BE526|nr:uncharacterized protein LOC114395257 [Glycine soja]
MLQTLVLSLVLSSMADNTSSKAVTDRLEEAVAKLMASQLSMSCKIDDLLNRMTHLETSHSVPCTPPSSSSNHSPQSPSDTFPRLKLEVSRFDGSDPTGWIFKITQFFEYHSTPDQERLTIASFYMEGAALAWFQWMHRNGQLTSWPAFLHALHTRFSSSTYKDPTGLLCKLTQRSSVQEYLSEFESLANRILGLPAPFLLSCFISGLSPAIRREVQALQPHSLTQATQYPRPSPAPAPSADLNTLGHLRPLLPLDLALPLPFHPSFPSHQKHLRPQYPSNASPPQSLPFEEKRDCVLIAMRNSLAETSVPQPCFSS